MCAWWFCSIVYLAKFVCVGCCGFGFGGFLCFGFGVLVSSFVICWVWCLVSDLSLVGSSFVLGFGCFMRCERWLTVLVVIVGIIVDGAMRSWFGFVHLVLGSWALRGLCFRVW